MIDNELKKYIEENVFPSYSKNDTGHNLEHIKYVINRSLDFAKSIPNINLNMVYTIAAYHDIGHYIDAKKHEEVSAKILLEDKNLKKFFSDEEISIMSEAVADHRASLENDPRSIYGKIVSSADRNTSVDVMLMRTYYYNIKHYPDKNLDELIEMSRTHMKNKFGRNGYAGKKMYFEDEKFIKFLDEVEDLVNNNKKFEQKFKQVNNL